MIDDYDGEDLYYPDEMRIIADTIEDAGRKEFYSADMDICEFKETFVSVMTELENHVQEGRDCEDEHVAAKDFMKEEISEEDAGKYSRGIVLAVLGTTTLVLGIFSRNCIG